MCKFVGMLFCHLLAHIRHLHFIFIVIAIDSFRSPTTKLKDQFNSA